MHNQLPRRADGTARRTVVFVTFASLLVLTLVMLGRYRRPMAPSATDHRDDQSDGQAAAQDKNSGRDLEMQATPHQYARDQERMIRRHLRARDITDDRVLKAMARVPRHLFVPEDWRDLAYADQALPIGQGQTISQPYIVALMTQLAQPEAHERALDVGTGSGYQAAILAELVEEVYSIEIVCPLADEARKCLQTQGHDNVKVRCGDGYRGWPAHAPFDVIIVAAAPDHVPQPLVDQLAVGGRLVIPVGSLWQELIVIAKDADGRTTTSRVADVRFVPMTGEAEE